MSSYSTLYQRPHTQGNTLHTRLLTTLIRHMELSHWDLWWIKPIFDRLHPPCIRNIKSNGAHTSLVNTTSRIAYNTIIAQTNESITAREVHGLLLCAGNTIRFVEGFIECNIPLSGCNIEADAPSQIVALSSPPCNSKSCMEKYQISLGSSTSTRITVQDRINTRNYAAPIVTTNFR